MSGSALADGTAIMSLVDEGSRTVAARVHVDEEIFRLEHERLFSRAWIALGHESELPDANSFVTRYLGLDPVVVTRSDDGTFTTFLNVCSHRGMQVCRAEAGSARRFTCPYHGWTFDTSGALRGVPLERERYGPAFDKGGRGLRQARTETYAGWIFATWDEEAPSLVDYLGDFRWYMDLMWLRTDAGMEVAGPPQRWVIPCNWKLAVDQFSGDAYHGLWLHRSLREIDYMPGGSDGGIEGVYGHDISVDGHSTRCADMTPIVEAAGSTRGALAMMPPPGMSVDQLPELYSRYDDATIDLLATHPPLGGTIFPSLSWLCLRMPTAHGTLGSVITPRIWIPRGVDRTEVLLWPMVERGASDEERQATIATTIQNFSSSGIWEQDDAESWASIQRNLAGDAGRKARFDYSSSFEPDGAGWPGGGDVWPGVNGDNCQWGFWRRWRSFVAGDPWSASAPVRMSEVAG
jgi:nitrite reductase/ring-hydroxylating ferredoxin subunit